jgi:phosphate transport system substrate-binding protein
MKKSTSWIIGGLLILVVGGVVITGYFTNWFGLVPTQTLKIAGSTTVLPITTTSAEAYMADHKSVSIEVAGGGSSVGVTSVANGSVDIGMASRAVKESEFTETPELIPWAICSDGIAVIIHPTNTIDDLTMDEIRQIFNGTITDWSAVGGAAGAITVINRDSASGTRSFFNEHVMDEDDFVAGAVELNSNGAVHDAVADAPLSIGYVGLGYLDAEVKDLQIEGIDATVANVQAGTYPISRFLYYVTNGYPNELAQDFISFVMSTAGKAIVADEGFVAFEDLSGETLSIAGSTTVLPILTTASPYFQMMTGITLEVAGGGSSVGVTTVGDGTSPVGMASRQVKPEEVVSYPGIMNHTICSDGIAVIIHPTNTIDDLTMDEIRQIFNGTITDWSAVGGAAGAITVINRDSASGTRSFFNEHVMDEDDFVAGAVELNSNGAVHDAVADAPLSIGYVGLGYLDTAVKALDVDGGFGPVTPSVESVADLSYPIARGLYLVTIDDVPAQTAVVQALFGFLWSRVGQYICNEEGFVALPEYAGGDLPA